MIGLTCICISNSVQSKLYQQNNFAVNLLVVTTSEVTKTGNGNVYKKSNILVCSRSDLLRQLRTVPTRCATCHPTLAGLVDSRQSHNKSSVSVGFAANLNCCGSCVQIPLGAPPVILPWQAWSTTGNLTINLPYQSSLPCRQRSVHSGGS